jgi:hypothetical protein
MPIIYRCSVDYFIVHAVLSSQGADIRVDLIELVGHQLTSDSDLEDVYHYWGVPTTTLEAEVPPHQLLSVLIRSLHSDSYTYVSVMPDGHEYVEPLLPFCDEYRRARHIEEDEE